MTSKTVHNATDLVKLLEELTNPKRPAHYALADIKVIHVPFLNGFGNYHPSWLVCW